jgi:energy-coupling factor transporter ATP-binding protein EcfA2
MPSDVSYFGITNGRLPYRPFGIKQADRLFHIYSIGRTGTGKSTLLETLALQDIHAGRGLCVIDPHGDLVERIVNQVPDSRLPDLVYFNAPDIQQGFGYNPLRRVRKDKVALAAGGLLDAFKKIWVNEWGVRMEHVLRNSLFALLEYGHATLPDVLRLLTDQRYRGEVLRSVTNEQVRAFFLNEYPKYNPRYRQEAIAPIQNKIGAFLADPRLYRIFTGEVQQISIRRIMDEGKILLVNLSKGELGEDSANLLGALLVSTVSLAAFSRAEIDQESRRPFFCYIDEFQNFTTLAVANMVSELRKFGVGLILAHQHLHQLEPEVRHAILGNAGTFISFRLGPEDAGVIGKELAPKFEVHDLVNLPNHDIFLKLMIDGAPGRAFSARALHPNQLYS